ncbi:hypothetical protein [Streptomyces sp. WAC 01325]|uniref:hypothetical protein n=1 Tax=Streptomyces sp. WAC 01325 TaxID=2203202 RepID=UPI000F86366A|nr:hypothetical protein [Streptomyces sp. WAC 01325]
MTRVDPLITQVIGNSFIRSVEQTRAIVHMPFTYKEFRNRVMEATKLEEPYINQQFNTLGGAGHLQEQKGYDADGDSIYYYVGVIALNVQEVLEFDCRERPYVQQRNTGIRHYENVSTLYDGLRKKLLEQERRHYRDRGKTWANFELYRPDGKKAIPHVRIPNDSARPDESSGYPANRDTPSSHTSLQRTHDFNRFARMEIPFLGEVPPSRALDRQSGDSPNTSTCRSVHRPRPPVTATLS